MKKWIFSIAIALFCASYADEAKEAEIVFKMPLKSMVSKDYTNSLYILSDGSSWRAIGIQKRWRDPGEWWSGDPLFSEEYLGSTSKWELGSKVQVFLKPDTLQVVYANAQNQWDIETAEYLIFNPFCNQYFFIKPVELTKAKGNITNNIALLARMAYIFGYSQAVASDDDRFSYRAPSISKQLESILELKETPEDCDEICSVLSAKITLQDWKSEGYYVLADGTCWKVEGMHVRAKTPMEWFTGATVVPQNYECLPSAWKVGARIEIYAKERYFRFFSLNWTVEEKLTYCTHLFYNVDTGQVLFANPMQPKDCIEGVFKDSFRQGFRNAWEKGSTMLPLEQCDYLVKTH